MPSFKQTKKNSWEYYKKWMKEDTECPVLNCKINVSRKGWDHLINGSNSRKRGAKDKHLRLSLLKQARYVINTANKYTVEIREGIEYTALEGDAKYGRQNITVRVLLKKDKKGNYYFFSVMKR